MPIQNNDTMAKLIAGHYNGVADTYGDDIVSIGIPTNGSSIFQIARFQ